MNVQCNNLFCRPYQKYAAAAAALDQMPPLPHSVPGMPYAAERSEAARWIATQPAVLEVLFSHARESGRIVFDPAAGKWRGRSVSP